MLTKIRVEKIRVGVLPAVWLVGAALSLPLRAGGQVTSPASPQPGTVPITSQTPAATNGTTTTTTTAGTGLPATKADEKAQRKQQKQNEKAAKQQAKSAKANAKSLKAQDKATNAEQKAQGSPQ